MPNNSFSNSTNNNNNSCCFISNNGFNTNSFLGTSTDFIADYK